MTTLDTKSLHETYVAQFQDLEKSSAFEAGAWLMPIRKAAIARFAESGFPTVRDEEWRFTNPAPIVQTEFSPACEATGDVRQDQFDAYLLNTGGPVLVFVNGFFAPGLSKADHSISGLTVCNLAEAIDRHASLVEPYLARFASTEGQAFTALNTAFARDGLFVHVNRGAVVEQPLEVVYVWAAGARRQVVHPRNLIVAEGQSQVTIVETHVGLGDGETLTNLVTEIIARDGAIVDHYKVQREAETAYHVSDLRIEQDRNTHVRSHAITFGAGLSRANYHAVLAGEGGECTLNGFSMLGGTQHADNHLRVEHAAPHCNSWEYFKSILDDQSRSVFTGRIFVHRCAQKTDALQTNKNLLLSDEAIADSKPQLEIFADDVKCSHGATIGQMDKDALFYLRSRGLDELAARGLLVFAFASESLAEVRVAPLRESLEKTMFDRLAV